MARKLVVGFAVLALLTAFTVPAFAQGSAESSVRGNLSGTVVDSSGAVVTGAKVTIKDDVAQEFVNWRGECKSTIRNSYQILSRGTPNLENELWNVSAQVLNGKLSPEDAGKQLEDGLAKWYKPHQK